MHQREEIYSPELCKYVIQQLNIHCGTSIPDPQFVNGTEQSETPPKPKRASKKS